MKNRTPEFRRQQRTAHISRKKRIIRDQGGYWHYKFAGDLDKGKIHCSCPMCRRKSYDRAQICDQRKAGSAIDELLDYGTEGEKAAMSILHRTKSDQQKSIKGIRPPAGSCRPAESSQQGGNYGI